MQIAPGSSPYVFVILDDNSVRMIDFVNEANQTSIKTIHDHVKSLKVCPNGRYVMSAGDKGDVVLHRGHAHPGGRARELGLRGRAHARRERRGTDVRREGERSQQAHQAQSRRLPSVRPRGYHGSETQRGLIATQSRQDRWQSNARSGVRRETPSVEPEDNPYRTALD